MKKIINSKLGLVLLVLGGVLMVIAFSKILEIVYALVFTWIF